MQIKYLFWLAGLCLIQACTPGTTDEQGLVKYVLQEKNGLIQAIQQQGINYTLSYIPREVVSLRQSGKNPSPTEYAASKKSFEDHQYFQLQIGTESGKNLEALLVKQYGETAAAEKMNYLRFLAQSDFQLTVDQQSFPCVLYHLEQVSVHPVQYRANLVFQIDDNQWSSPPQDVQVQFANQLSQQPITFSFAASYLARIPALKNTQL